MDHCWFLFLGNSICMHGWSECLEFFLEGICDRIIKVMKKQHKWDLWNADTHRPPSEWHIGCVCHTEALSNWWFLVMHWNRFQSKINYRLCSKVEPERTLCKIMCIPFHWWSWIAAFKSYPIVDLHHLPLYGVKHGSDVLKPFLNYCSLFHKSSVFHNIGWQQDQFLACRVLYPTYLTNIPKQPAIFSIYHFFILPFFQRTNADYMVLSYSILGSQQLLWELDSETVSGPAMNYMVEWGFEVGSLS